MSISRNQVFKALAIAIAAASAGSASAAKPLALAAKPQAATASAEPAQHWSASSGTVGVRWNRELANDLGMALGAASGRYAQLSGYDHEVFNLRPAGSLDFSVSNGNLRAFVGGALQAAGGHVIDTPSGRIDMTDFRLIPRLGAKGAEGGAPVLDIVSSDGKAWFYVDRLMYELINDKQTLAVRTMDLRITPELAARIGHPEVAGWVIADMELTTNVVRQGLDPVPLAISTKWHGLPVPGVPGAVYQADLFMRSFGMQYSRCNGCTGAGGNGGAVFTPSSELRNNVNTGSLQATVPGDPLGTSSALYAADVPWYAKFSGNFPPYNNDQHPYLIWNLYRFNVDGSIDQIGRSGVKHAFLTLNTDCSDNPGDSHILGRGCSDVYSVSNNDATSALGPRSEIIPASNLWGRCGSIYDTNCDGVGNGVPNDVYAQRLVVRESQFSGPAQAGATYLFESWYLARQDINILNSMGTVRATFTRNSTVWSVGGNDQYKLGPAIDRWVDPAAPPAGGASVTLNTAEGMVKVAAKSTNLGGGRWRYDYAVMNLDFARAVTTGAEPNLRVISNLGLNGLTIPVGSATITDLSFGDGDLDAANDWTASVGGRNVTWTAPTGNALNWGTLFRFSFIANQGPARGAFALGVATPGTPATLKGTGMIGPSASRLIGPGGISGN